MSGTRADRRLRHDAGILRARLVPPRAPPQRLDRPDLVDRVAEGLGGRLVAVVAGAGYGKTTLLVQTAERVTLPCVWLSCDERIRSSALLLGHLAAGLEERFPGVASALDVSGPTREAVKGLSNEILATIPDDFVLILDDVHALSGGSRRALGLLASDLPPTAHLAVASRTALPFPMGRWRAAGVLELGEDALAMSDDEVDELLRSLRMAPTAEDVARIRDRTEGWPAGVRLAATSGVHVARPGGEDALAPDTDYLAEEVIGRLDDETRRFMIATSIVERFTPGIAEAVTGRAGARSTIESLVADHAFIIRLAAEQEWYRYHHLLLTLLRRRVAEMAGDEVAELHRRAGTAWLAAGEAAEAIPHLLEAGELERAARVLEPVAETMVRTPAAEALAEWIERIPDDIASRRPGLVLAEAWLLFGRSEHDAAFDAMELAIERLLAAGDQERAAAAFFRLLAALSASGVNPHVRGLAARRFLPRFRPDVRMLPPARVMLASSFAYAGRYEDAEAELAAALESPAAPGLAALATYATVNRAQFVEHWQGRSLRALAMLDDAIAWLETNRSRDELAYLGWSLGYRAVLLGHLGRWPSVIEAADRWEREMQRSGQGAAGGTSSWMRFQALAALGRWEELEAILTEAKPFAARIPGSLFDARYRVGAAALEAHRGDRAAVAGRVAAVRDQELPSFFRSVLLADLAAPAGAAGLLEHARDLLGRSRDAARAARAPWALARAAAMGAELAEDGPERDALISEALQATGRLDNLELWTSRERGLAPRLLARALDAGLGPQGLAGRLLAACGGEVLSEACDRLAAADPATRVRLAAALGEATIVEPSLVRRMSSDPDDGVRAAGRAAAARLARRPGPPVTITTLGGFSVTRADAEVPPLALGRGGRARALLAILVSAEGPVHREALLEWLWPHLVPQRGLASLHTNIHMLRQALEPRIWDDEPTLILTEGDSYRLALGPSDRWDVDRLRSLARTAESAWTRERALAVLIAAETIARQPFLPEWPYEEWAAPLRSEVDQVRRTLLERLADVLVAVGEPRAAADRLERLLAIEPEREAWHRGLMRAYSLAGERGLALRQYHACRRILRDELGVGPSDETRRLYASLL